MQVGKRKFQVEESDMMQDGKERIRPENWSDWSHESHEDARAW
jgi:hypothetical protein